MPVNYFLSPSGGLASGLDRAWDDYQNKSFNRRAKQNALDFMIYVFDIAILAHKKDSLEGVLIKLMEQRALRKAENPNYIPIVVTAGYQFDKILRATSTPRISSIQEVQDAFNAGELLDVNAEDKIRDGLDRITYLTDAERAEYNIEIYNGLFYKSGKIFDCSNLEAHDRPGYVAFTLNTSGELSVFSHLSSSEDKKGNKLAHSSMNAGAPLLAVGEMEIKKGVLISINTFSGHYGPSIHALVRFLAYLSDRGIDISQTKVFLQKPMNITTGLQTKRVYLFGEIWPWYEIDATELVCSVKSIVRQDITSLNGYLNSRRTKIHSSFFKLSFTPDKVRLGTGFQKELETMLEQMSHLSSYREIKVALVILDFIITNYLEQHANISEDSGRLGRICADMKTHLGVTRAKVSGINEERERSRGAYFKVGY